MKTNWWIYKEITQLYGIYSVENEVRIQPITHDML